jgi:hypothetical protein
VSTDWSAVWHATSLAARWQAFHAYRKVVPAGTVADFLALGPYVRCSWLSDRLVHEDAEAHERDEVRDRQRRAAPLVRTGPRY